MFSKSTFKPVNVAYASNALYAYSNKLDERAKIRKAAIDAANEAYKASIGLIKRDYITCILKFVKDTVVIGLSDIFPDIEEKCQFAINSSDWHTCIAVSFNALGNQYENLLLEYEQRAGYGHRIDAALWHIRINGIRIKSERLRYNIFKELRKEMETRNKNTGEIVPPTSYAEFIKVRDIYLAELCENIQHMLNDEFPNKCIKACVDDVRSDMCVHIKAEDEFLPIKYSIINQCWYYRSGHTYELSYDTVIRTIQEFYDKMTDEWLC